MVGTLLTYIAVTLRIISNPLGNVYQKQLTIKGHHPMLINFLTYLLLSLTCIFILFTVTWKKLPGEFWIYSILGGIVGALGNGFLVKALQQGDLSILGPINSYKSVVGIVVAIFLLGEIPNLLGLAGVAIIIFGSYLVLDTTEEKFSWALLKNTGIQFRIWAMILTAIEAVFVKKVILASDITTAFISWCVFGAILSFLLLGFYRLNLKTEISKLKAGELGKYLLLIICIGTMQFTTNYVFANMPVGYALSLFQLSTLVSVFFGYRFFKEKDIRKKLLGAAIMIAGSVMIILMKDR
ncbi:MAG TPA: EamA family transporter [Chitinophagaceae bacterium]